MRHLAHLSASIAVLLSAPLLGLTLLVTPALVAPVLAAPASAAGDTPVPGTFAGGTLTKTGWWARSNEQPPETGLLAPPSVPAVAAPAGTLPVSAIAGEAERITALEFALEGDEGDEVGSVVLALKEAADPAANPNSASGTVTACPMTEAFWVPVDNGPWATRPTYDCAAGAVAGTRDDKGVWTFDLTPLASQWLATDREFAPAVVLVSTPPTEPTATDPPEPASSTFQVAYDKAAGVGLVARTLAQAEDEDPAEPEPTPEPEAEPPGGVGGGATGGLGGVGDAILEALPEALPVETAPPAAIEASPPETTTSALAPVAAPVLAWHDEIGAKALLAVPALLLAYLVMLAMGPAGQPAVGGGRRGVSRALDRMRTAGVGSLGGRSLQ
ncbi:hypothetical protein [Nocardioides dilutus]